MKFSVQNLGNIKHAEIDLDKDLIIFCGHNNTGKTYLAYAVWGVYKYNNNVKDIAFDDISFAKKYIYNFSKRNYPTIYQLVEKIINIGYLTINIDEIIETLLIDIRSFHTDSLNIFQKKILGEDEVVALEQMIISTFTNNLTLMVRNIGKIRLIDVEGKSYKIITDSIEFPIYGIGVTNRGQDDEDYLDIVHGFLPSQLGHDVILKEINESDINAIGLSLIFIFTNIFRLLNPSRLRFLPIERLAISTFSKEIYNNRFDVTNEMMHLNGKERDELLKKRVNSYPLPVEEFIKSQQNLSNIKNKISPFSDLADELESHILKGKIVIDENGETFFKIGKNKRLQMQVSGSTVKSLSHLVVYLRHQAEEGDVFIIDEPELNLHPDNQRFVARIFAKMVNRGIKVILSTHSDYILREFNNMIMLNQNHEEKARLMQKYGYDEAMILNHAKIGTYFFELDEEGDCEVKDISPDEKGIEVSSINQQIEELNQAEQEIYYTLFD
ncbi:MAG: AAA family ATPase [Bacteroidia bacterium]